MNENYIVINGKKEELTEEQLKLLGIETRKNPFKRVEGDDYYYVKSYGDVWCTDDSAYSEDNYRYDAANYFNDEQFAEQVALHQLLYRKLLKFAYDNGCEDTAEWNGIYQHWFIRYSCDTGDLVICVDYYYKGQNVYFSSDKAAKRAGREVVEPFMKENPDFVW